MQFAVRPLRKEDIPKVIEISMKEFGSDYFYEPDFVAAMKRQDYICNVVADDLGTVGGFVLVSIFGPDKVDKELNLPTGSIRDKMLTMKKIGLIDAIAISNEFKGMGLGTMLFDSALNYTMDNKVNVICGMAWKSYRRNVANIQGIFDKNGLKQELEIQGYWNTMVSGPDGHDCAECGRPCKCYAVLFTKYL